MRAVILAGGKGTRLRPYTTVLPKPLVPIADRPILELVIQQLARHGFTRIDLSVGHLGGLIKAYLDHIELPDGLDLRPTVWEDVPLGTAGALTRIEGLDEPFLAMNGDVLTTLDYAQLMRFHKGQDARADDRHPPPERRHRSRRDRVGRRLRDGVRRETDHALRRQHGGLRLRPRSVLELIPERRTSTFPMSSRRCLRRGRKVAIYTGPACLVRHRDRRGARARHGGDRGPPGALRGCLTGGSRSPTSRSTRRRSRPCPRPIARAGSAWAREPRSWRALRRSTSARRTRSRSPMAPRRCT